MKAHHVPLRQNAEGAELGKGQKGERAVRTVTNEGRGSGMKDPLDSEVQKDDFIGRIKKGESQGGKCHVNAADLVRQSGVHLKLSRRHSQRFSQSMPGGPERRRL